MSLYRKATEYELALETKIERDGMAYKRMELPVANAVANAPAVVANRRKDRHKDKEARRIYMRELMRKRRANARNSNP